MYRSARYPSEQGGKARQNGDTEINTRAVRRSQNHIALQGHFKEDLFSSQPSLKPLCHLFQPPSDGKMLGAHLLALAAFDTGAGFTEPLPKVAVQHQLGRPRFVGQLLYICVIIV